MPLITGAAALAVTGTLDTHSTVFQTVADATKCVISSRAVGKYATGLLREGYATKGFHNKAKSCNWGPMAGFVLSDPRFTKRGDSPKAMEEQRRDVFKAFKYGATEVPVMISEARRIDLLKPPLSAMRLGWKVDFCNHYYFANSPSGKLFLFHLHRTEKAPGPYYGKPLWIVQYAYTEAALQSNLLGTGFSDNLNFLPVMAMVDTATRASVVGTHLSATTGDYDLFAVFPKTERFDATGQDKRRVPGSERFRMPIRAFIQHEDAELGNITRRIRSIRDQINRLAAHAGGDIVHHSDEAGRPLVNDIDFPFIAWVPRHTAPYAVSTVNDFKAFIALLNFEYVLALNPGWLRQLGFGVSQGGSYVV